MARPTNGANGVSGACLVDGSVDSTLHSTKKAHDGALVVQTNGAIESSKATVQQKIDYFEGGPKRRMPRRARWSDIALDDLPVAEGEMVGD